MFTTLQLVLGALGCLGLWIGSLAFVPFLGRNGSVLYSPIYWLLGVFVLAKLVVIKQHWRT